MTYYRETYRDSVRRTDQSLTGRRVLVYCEQGLGDTIQFARYLKYLDAELILHVEKPLHRLLSQIENVVETHEKFDPQLPEHDLHILTLDLPFILKRYDAEIPYLSASPIDVEEAPLKVGISWEGNPENEMNEERSCPLKLFRELPGQKYMLQHKIRLAHLTEDCSDMELLSVPMNDMQDAAELISAMDVVVSVDTAPLHLAGALGKPSIALLCRHHDARWSFRRWYDDMRVLRQTTNGDWSGPFSTAKRILGERWTSITDK